MVGLVVGPQGKPVVVAATVVAVGVPPARAGEVKEWVVEEENGEAEVVVEEVEGAVLSAVTGWKARTTLGQKV